MFNVALSKFGRSQIFESLLRPEPPRIGAQPASVKLAHEQEIKPSYLAHLLL